MPLIVISGYPCAGNTYRAKQLADDFNARKKDDDRFTKSRLHLINDDSLSVSRSAYNSARTEKDARAEAMSAIKRLLTRDDVVIADGMNYIKGYRYQLHCEAKALRTPSCVVHVGTPLDTCRTQYNTVRTTTARTSGTNTRPAIEEEESLVSADHYDPETFENLLYRYEEPNGMTRWDSPLFTVVHDDPTPPFDAIWDAMFGARPSSTAPPQSQTSTAPSSAESAKSPRTTTPTTTTTLNTARRKVLNISVKPNAATVLAPAASADYLYALDRDTSAVISAIQAHQSSRFSASSVTSYGADTTSYGAEAIEIEGAEDALVLPEGRVLGVAELQRLRRQFVQMMRAQGAMAGAGVGTGGTEGRVGNERGRTEKGRVKSAFVGYLNDLWERE